MFSALKRICTRSTQQSEREPALPAAPISPEQLASNTYQMLERMLGSLVEDRKSERRATIVKRILLLTIPLIPLIYIVSSGYDRFASKRDGLSVPVIKIDGVIGSEADGGSASILIPQLERAFNGPGNRVVLLVNSPGGSPGDAERIRAAIVDLKRRTNKKVDALIDGQGASAAYMISLAADRITASRYSLVGSIGVIVETWDASELANKNGVRTHIYKSGAAKALGGTMHTPTVEEQAAANELVSTMAALFKSDVTKYRAGKLRAGIDALSDGRVWVGEQALALGLIDNVATPEEFYTSEGIKPAPTTSKGLSLRSMMQGAVSLLLEAVPSAITPIWR